MIKYENECVSCSNETYPCMGESCPYTHVKRYYCDECGEETDLYNFYGEELCIDCIISNLTKVE